MAEQLPPGEGKATQMGGMEDGHAFTSGVNSVWRKTLEELDGEDWGEPPFPSHLVTTCHRLRRKALHAFTVEDLRIMIGQKFSLEYLVPLAIQVLERNPLAHGDVDEGDLLTNVLRAPSDFWQERPDLWSRVLAILGNAERAWARSGELNDLEPPFEPLADQFLNNQPSSLNS